MHHPPQNLLSTGLERLNLSLDSSSQKKLLEFMDFLQKWNQCFNLTAITRPDEMVSYLLLDSLSIAPYIQGNRIVDVGSGAGFPGIPLAVYFPDKQWLLVDSNGKKTRFLTQAKAEFQLKNVEVIQQRIETWQPEIPVDTIVSRAAARIHQLLEQTQHLFVKNGTWLLMKGMLHPEELRQISHSYQLQDLSVPGIVTERHLIIIYREDQERST